MTPGAAAAMMLLATAAAEPVHVRLRETVRLECPGAVAAYTVDGRVADASVVRGAVLVRGRDAGETHVTIVEATGALRTRLVVVERPPPRFAVPAREAVGGARTAVGAAYDSAVARVTTSLEHARTDGDRAVRVDVVNVTRVEGPPTGDAPSVLARASVDVRTPGWRATLLDARVQESALSLDGITLRGAHLSAGGLALHAGYASPAWYRGFLLPADRESAAGGSFRLSLGEGMTLAPVIYAFGGAARTRGAMGSIRYDVASPRSPFRLSAEAGWGGRPAGALQLALDGRAGRIAASARRLPRAFASLASGRPPGDAGELLATVRPWRRLDLVGSASFTREDLSALAQRRVGASGEARVSLGAAWLASAGVSTSRSRAGSAAIESLSLPLSLTWRPAGGELSAQYRYRRHSLLDGGGHGGRLQGAVRTGGLAARAYVDVQQADATLELIFRESPELARLFAELGLEARTPEDVEALLRAQPGLAGEIRGASVALHPWRVVAGGELSWRSGDGSRQELRANLLIERARTTRALSDGGVASLWYGRRVTRSIDGFAAVSGWSRDRGVAPGRGWSWSAGFRIALDGAPRWPWAPDGVVEGRVFRDAAGEGRHDDDAAGEAGARVRIDNEREVVTDARGWFRFEDVGPGEHRVEVLLPGVAGAYFTTPAVVTAIRGQKVLFGVAQIAARVSGALRNDAGAGIAGAAVLLAGPVSRSATTDSSGAFTVEAPAGDYVLSVDPASLPPGHDLGSLAPRPVRLTRDAPAHEQLQVRAFRSISGTVRGRPPGTLVWLVEPYLKRVLGPDGRYVFRDVQPGRYTIAVHAGDRFEHRIVDVPAGPATVHGVDFGAPPR